MKRTVMILMAMMFSMLIAVSNGNATESAAGPTGAGDSITVDCSGIDGADNLVFNPSPQVQMSYWSNAGGFSHNAVHAAAIGTAGGMAYGMADDTNKVFWTSSQATTFALTAVGTSNSTEWTSTQTEYNPMN